MPDERPRFCECCGRSLNNKRIKWLELNSKDGFWSDPDKVKVPDDESQGLFAFGSRCAVSKLRAQSQHLEREADRRFLWAKVTAECELGEKIG
jgi:hypothetical protein